jgi:hypothetical protein
VSQFTFLQSEWAAVYEAASKAEAAVHADPRTACFYSRRALELAVSWAYKYDPALRLPYQDNLSALIHEPSFKQTARLLCISSVPWHSVSCLAVRPFGITWLTEDSYSGLQFG